MIAKNNNNTSYEGLSEKWVSACDLKKGDRVLLANADSLTGKPKYGIVVSVKTEQCEEFTTYNFEVKDFHTYYVGENSVLVHNTGCAKEFLKSPKTGKETAAFLKKNGFEQVRQKGSHMIMSNGTRTVPVPDHGAKELGKGLLKAIIKQAGLL